MTYKEFIQGIRDQADFLERVIEDSQIVELRDEMGEDDTIIMAYEYGVEEFMDNVTGKYGHKLDLPTRS